MNHLLPLLKKIEIELRSSEGQINTKEIWEQMAELPDWENRIIQDFILRVRMAIGHGDLNFMYRHFEKNSKKLPKKLHGPKYDLCIASLRRNQNDTPLTDCRNRLHIPSGMTVDVMDIFGMEVVQARNVAVIEAMKRGAKKLLFIDDDILVPVNALHKLLALMNKTKKDVVAGDYYKKIEPLTSAHLLKAKVDVEGFDEDIYETGLCAMGFCLINLETLGELIPAPWFWAFGDPNDPRYWSMGEDAFFTHNLKQYSSCTPLVIDLKLIHYDKSAKKIYGGDTRNITYASSQFSSKEQFDELRTPEVLPSILIGVPTREENSLILTNLKKLPIPRGYAAEMYQVWGLPVDEARTAIVEEALKRKSDYLMFIDDDVILPYDAIHKLVEHIEKSGVDAVSGDYPLKGIPTNSIHLQKTDNKMIKHIDSCIPEDIKFFESNWLIGLGCVLIDMRIFKQAQKPWFVCHNQSNDGSRISEDAHFSELARINGFRIWVDRNVKCLHVDLKNEFIYTPLATVLGIDVNSYAFNPEVCWISKFKFKCLDKELE